MDRCGLDWKACKHLSGWELTWESHLTKHHHQVHQVESHIAKHWSDRCTASLCTCLSSNLLTLEVPSKGSTPRWGRGDWLIRHKLGRGGSKEETTAVRCLCWDVPPDPNSSDDVSVERESSLRPVGCLQLVLGWQNAAVAESASSLAGWWPATRDSIAAITHPPSAHRSCPHAPDPVISGWWENSRG